MTERDEALEQAREAMVSLLVRAGDRTSSYQEYTDAGLSPSTAARAESLDETAERRKTTTLADALLPIVRAYGEACESKGFLFGHAKALEEYLEQVKVQARREALEEAERLCEAQAEAREAAGILDTYADACEDLAASIRALADQPGGA